MCIRDSFEGGVVGGKLIGGGNMVAMHLAKAVGGDMLLGFLAAVAFATILAVVSGLALALSLIHIFRWRSADRLPRDRC